VSPTTEPVASGGPPLSEQGFTLIEMLVVTAIIAILSAIGVPMFLNQREKGYDSAAKSDLRQLAHAEDSYLVSNTGYATIASIEASGMPVTVSNGVMVTVVRYVGLTAYCLSSRHSGSTETWYYDSQAGGIQPKGTFDCPVTNAATPGVVAGDSKAG
jgi:type IV pilus assembly protein PilA